MRAIRLIATHLNKLLEDINTEDETRKERTKQEGEENSWSHHKAKPMKRIKPEQRKMGSKCLAGGLRERRKSMAPPA